MPPSPLLLTTTVHETYPGGDSAKRQAMAATEDEAGEIGKQQAIEAFREVQGDETNRPAHPRPD